MTLSLDIPRSNRRASARPEHGLLRWDGPPRHVHSPTELLLPEGPKSTDVSKRSQTTRPACHRETHLRVGVRLKPARTCGRHIISFPACTEINSQNGNLASSLADAEERAWVLGLHKKRDKYFNIQTSFS